MIRNWYNQIPYPGLKTKMKITKYINWQQFMKDMRGKPNDQPDKEQKRKPIKRKIRTAI